MFDRRIRKKRTEEIKMGDGSPLLGEGGRGLSEGDDYLSRLIKFIPAEIIAAYLTLENTILGAKEVIPNHEYIFWVVFVILIIFVPIYVAKFSKVDNRWHLFISTCCFVVWSFSIGGPFSMYEWYNEIYGAILLPLFTLGTAFFIPDSEL